MSHGGPDKPPCKSLAYWDHHLSIGSGLPLWFSLSFMYRDHVSISPGKILRFGTHITPSKPQQHTLGTITTGWGVGRVYVRHEHLPTFFFFSIVFLVFTIKFLLVQMVSSVLQMFHSLSISLFVLPL